MRYLAASIVIAAAAAVYGLFSHGVYSYFMTYAFMVPLLAGALPHLTAALKTACGKACGSLYETRIPSGSVITDGNGHQTPVRARIRRGALDIYGTTNKLLVGYPAAAAVILAAASAMAIKNKKIKNLQKRCNKRTASCVYIVKAVLYCGELKGGKDHEKKTEYRRRAACSPRDGNDNERIRICFRNEQG